MCSCFSVCVAVQILYSLSENNQQMTFERFTLTSRESTAAYIISIHPLKVA